MSAANGRFYFDHNASAPLLPEARAALLAGLVAGNASSVHAEGRNVRSAVERARTGVAALCATVPENVVFTSGATEAANTALVPLWRRNGSDVLVSRLAVCETDHPCTREGGRFSPKAVSVLPVDRNGHIRAQALADWVRAGTGQTSLLAITLANNESGVIQPIAPILRALEGHDVLFVVDAVQAAGRVPFAIEELGADALILSGHKIGATTGVGALVLRDGGTCPAPLLRGGGQELGRRAGTHAVPAIASFGAASTVAAERTAADRARLQAMRARLEAQLHAAGEIVILGDEADRLGNTVFFGCHGLKAETAQIALDLQGFAVSGGSACSSGKVAASPVLAAHARAGLPIDPAEGAIRVSFGYETTEGEIDAIAAALTPLIQRAEAASLRLRADDAA